MYFIYIESARYNFAAHMHLVQFPSIAYITSKLV